MPSVNRSGGERSASSSMVGRVVLEPGQPAGRVEPDAAEEPELADGRRDVLRQPSAGHHDEQHRGLRAVEPLGHEHDAARRSRARTPPRRPRARRRSATGRRRIGAYHSSHSSARRSAVSRAPMPARRTSLPAGAVVPRVKRWRASRSCGATRFLDDPLDARPPRGGEEDRHGQHARCKTSAGVDRHQQHDGEREAEDPADRREQRQEHVVEREHLVAQHAQPVEVLGPLVVLDRRHRRLEAGDVRLEGDADLVAEAALHPVEQHPHVPGAHGREAPARRPRPAPWSGSSLVTPSASSAIHSATSASGTRGEQGHRERADEQPRLGAVAELHHPPQRAQRRREVVVREVVRRATQAPPPRLRSSSSTKRDACMSNIVR